VRPPAGGKAAVVVLLLLLASVPTRSAADELDRFAVARARRDPQADRAATREAPPTALRRVRS
jgi:hypothetical protein